MLAPARVAEALEAQREGLVHAAQASEEAVTVYGRALDRVLRSDSADLADRLGGYPWPGGRPTPDMDISGGLVPFPLRWESAQEAREWALETLRGVPTAAVDGSQIAASKEFGAPISLVQVGWFLNPHSVERPYVKDVRNILLVPEE